MLDDLFPTRIADKWEIYPIYSGDNIECDYEEFNEFGFVVLRDFFPEPPSLNRIGKGPFFEVMEKDGSAVRTHLNLTDDPFLSSVEIGLLGYAESIFGEAFYTHQSRINYKRGFGADGWHWHSDFETWHAQDGMPSPACFTAMIPLTENTCENGALMVMPGTHRYFYSAPKGETVGALENFTDQRDGVPDANALIHMARQLGVGPTKAICCKPGDLVLFHSNLLHCSNPNRTGGMRANLYFVLNAVTNRLVAPFTGEQPRPEAMAHRERSYEDCDIE